MTLSPDSCGKPPACTERTPACACGDTGSVSSAPCIPPCPRGSSISRRRSSSPCFLSHASLSPIVRPATEGPPPTTSRTASPPTCASMVVSVCIKKGAAEAAPLPFALCPQPLPCGYQLLHLFLHPRVEVCLALD